MQIIVDIRRGEDGRATGTVRAIEESVARAFSGNLEFLALIESLYEAVGELDPVRDETVSTGRTRPKGAEND